VCYAVYVLSDTQQWSRRLLVSPYFLEAPGELADLLQHTEVALTASLWAQLTDAGWSWVHVYAALWSRFGQEQTFGSYLDALSCGVVPPPHDLLLAMADAYREYVDPPEIKEWVAGLLDKWLPGRQACPVLAERVVGFIEEHRDM